MHNEPPRHSEGCVSLVRFDDVEAVPWANGAGTTVELVTFEASRDLTPGLPRWRLSVASLDLPAAFSPLPGVHRRFMPVGGDVVLSIDGRREAVGAGEVAAFEGGQDVVLTELGRPCHAVNLMVEGRPELRLSRVAAGTPLPASVLLVISIEGSAGQDRFELLRPPARADGETPAGVLPVACAVIELAAY